MGAAVSTEPVRKGSNYAWAIAGSGFLGQMVASTGVGLWGMTLAYLAASFGVETTDLAIGSSLFGLAYSGLCFLWGSLADKIGVRKVMTVGPIGVGISLLVTGLFATTPIAAIIGYTCAGIFLGAVGVAIAPKLVSTWFATHSRGKGTAVVIVGGSVGGVLFGIAGPALINAGGWQACFIGIAILSFVAAIVLFLVIRDNPESVGKLPYGIERETAQVLDQKTIQEQIDQEGSGKRLVTILKMGNTWKMGLVFIFYQIYYVAHQTFFITALMESGFDLTLAGLISSLTYVGICIGQLLVPTISDRLGRKYVLGATLCLSGIVYLVLYFILRNGASSTGVLVFVFFAGILFACNAMMQVTMAEVYPPNLRGAGPGVVNTFGLVGKFLGPIIIAALIANVGGGAATSYMLFSAPCAIIAAIIALVALPKTGGKYGDPLAEQYARDVAAASAKE